MPEKLLTIKEAAECLKVSEEEVKRLVDISEIPAYKIGGTFLRFRRDQIEAIRTEIADIEEAKPEHANIPLDVEGRTAHPYTDMEEDFKRSEPEGKQYDYTLAERARDFFYFNDFYLLSLAVVAVLLYLIFKP